jgi:hypothetical protein
MEPKNAPSQIAGRHSPCAMKRASALGPRSRNPTDTPIVIFWTKRGVALCSQDEGNRVVVRRFDTTVYVA